MDESISSAAGASHGKELPPEAMATLIASLGRTARQRTTLYGEADACTQARGRLAAPLAPLVQTPPRKRLNRESENA
jgi:FO synthase